MHMIVGEAGAAHECGSANYVARRHQFRDDLFTAQAILRGQYSAPLKQMRDGRERLACLAGLSGDNAKTKFWQLARISRGLQACVKIVATRHSQTALIEIARAFL